MLKVADGAAYQVIRREEYHLDDVPRRPLAPAGARHISFWTPCWLRGGLETVTLAHLYHWLGLGWRVSLVCGYDSEMRDLVPPGVEYVCLPNLFESEYPPPPEMTELTAGLTTCWCRRTRPDVIVGALCHGPHVGFRLAGTPLILEYWHGGAGWCAVEKPTDRVVCVSAWARDFVFDNEVQHRHSNRPDVMPSEVAIVPNGCPEEPFPWANRERRRAARAKLLPAADERTFVVGYSGRFSREKRPVDWVHVLGRVRVARANTIAFMAGSHFEDVFGSLCRSEARAAGFTPGTDFVHREFAYTEMGEFYAACDVILHLCDVEGFGMATLETLFTGTPMVALAGGATPELSRSLAPAGAREHSGLHLVASGVPENSWATVALPEASKARLAREVLGCRGPLSRRERDAVARRYSVGAMCRGLQAVVEDGLRERSGVA